MELGGGSWGEGGAVEGRGGELGGAGGGWVGDVGGVVGRGGGGGFARGEDQFGFWGGGHVGVGGVVDTRWMGISVQPLQGGMQMALMEGSEEHELDLADDPALGG